MRALKKIMMWLAVFLAVATTNAVTDNSMSASASTENSMSISSTESTVLMEKATPSNTVNKVATKTPIIVLGSYSKPTTANKYVGSVSVSVFKDNSYSQGTYGELAPGTPVEVTWTDGTPYGWTEIKYQYNGKTVPGYVFTNNLISKNNNENSATTSKPSDNSSDSTVKPTTANKYVGTYSVSVFRDTKYSQGTYGELAPGTPVEVTWTDGTPYGWTEIKYQYNGKTVPGYVFTNNLISKNNSENSATTSKTSDNSSDSSVKPITANKYVGSVSVSVFKDNSYSQGTYGELAPGTPVEVTWTDGTPYGWTEIKYQYNGKTVPGYVFTNNLVSSKIENNTTVETPHNTKVASIALPMNKIPDSNSWYNICHAIEQLQGYVISPGELFSWAGVMGPCNLEQGYVMSGGYYGNEVVLLPGSGICYNSTLLFQTAREYGLTIVERHDHSMPVTYAQPGNEATVSYGGPDMKFRNNTNDSIRIDFYIDYSSYTVTCTFTAV